MAKTILGNVIKWSFYLSDLPENVRLKAIPFFSSLFHVFDNFQVFIPITKKNKVVRDDLPLPNSTNPTTLTVRNQRKVLAPLVNRSV